MIEDIRSEKKYAAQVKDGMEDAHDNKTNSTEDANTTRKWKAFFKDAKEDYAGHKATNSSAHNGTHNGTNNASHPVNQTDVVEDAISKVFLQALWKDHSEDAGAAAFWNKVRIDANEDHNQSHKWGLIFKDYKEDAHDNTTNKTDSAEDANSTKMAKAWISDIKEDSAPHNASYNGSHSANLTKDNKEDTATKAKAAAMLKEGKEDYRNNAFWQHQFVDGKEDANQVQAHYNAAKAQKLHVALHHHLKNHAAMHMDMV